MSLKKNVRCHIRMDSRWAGASAVCMGISLFLRTVYYFGLVNLKDLGSFEIAMQMILPLVVAAGYLLMIKALRINSPILFSGLVAVYAVNYILIMDGSASALVGAVLLVLTAGLFLLTGMGYLPYRAPLIAVGLLALLFRVIVVDLLGYLLPISQFHPIAYLPEASNLFGLAAISTMCPAVQLSPIRRASEEKAPDAAEGSQDASLPDEAAEPVPMTDEAVICSVSLDEAAPFQTDPVPSEPDTEPRSPSSISQ